jgi:hypothetical protein
MDKRVDNLNAEAEDLECRGTAFTWRDGISAAGAPDSG